MVIRKAFKYRIYPNISQQAALAVQFGHARFVYNWALARRKDHYKETGDSLNGFTLNKELTTLKRNVEYGWLKQADSQVLQQKTKDLDSAYKRFFEMVKSGALPPKGKKPRKDGMPKGYPTYHSKHDVQSIRYPQRFKVKGKKVYLPKVGWVKLVKHRSIEGDMKNCTVTKTKSGKYFVSIQCEVEIDDPAFEGGQVGIDLGIKDFATLSTGEKIDNPKYLRKSEKRLVKLQRRLSRKVKGSSSRNKQRIKVARFHEKIANQRRDFHHKLSHRLATKNRLIALENLNIAGMVKNHCLAKSISDVGWSEFVRQVEYKGTWYGCNVEKVNRFFASSKLCSECGTKNHSLKLSDRTWVCLECGALHDRDKNAADNILQEGFRLINTVGATEINAGGENVRPEIAFAIPAVSAKPEAHLL